MGLGLGGLTLSEGGGGEPEYSWDFLTGTYVLDGEASDLATATDYTGAAGYNDQLDGDWESFSANVLRLTDRSLRLEPAVTNGIRNPDNDGADAANNWFPANYDIYVGGGLSWDIVSLVTLDGLPAIRFRLYGTASSLNGAAIWFETGTAIDAVQGNTRTLSMQMATVAGMGTGTANIDNLRFRMDECTEAGSKINDDHYGPNLVGLVSTTGQRFALTGTMSQATCAHERPYLEFVYLNGANIDLYLDIGFRQDEAGPIAHSPVKGSRAADQLTLNNLGAGTRDLVVTYADATTQTIPDVTGGSYALDPANLDGPQVARIDWRSV